MKLHLACGDVYLDGWINIDAPGKVQYASFVPDMVKECKTNINNYYKGKCINEKGNVIVDKCMNLLDVPYPYDDNSIDKILIVGAFEHFSKIESFTILREWYRILKPDGKLIIDVPDLKETMKLLETNPDWAMRLIYGSQKDKYAFHKWGYTPESLERICKWIGFREANVIHLIEHEYPMFQMEVIK